MNNAISRRMRLWEYRNERTLWKLVENSAEITVECVKKAGLITSFLLYIVYKALEGVLAITRMMFVGPRLIRHNSPGAFEYVESTTAERSHNVYRI